MSRVLLQYSAWRGQDTVEYMIMLQRPDAQSVQIDMVDKHGALLAVDLIELLQLGHESQATAPFGLMLLAATRAPILDMLPK